MKIDRRKFVAGLGAGVTISATSGISFAQSSNPIRIGALNPVTGAGSPYGTGMQKMIIAAADRIKDAGGVAGRKIEVIAEEGQTNPQAAVLAAKKLIEVNGVKA